MIYLLDEDGKRARLYEMVNLPAGTKTTPATVTIGSGDDVWNFSRVIETSHSQIVEGLEEKFERLPAGPWTDDWTKRALALPLAKAGAQELPAGFLVAGTSPRLVLNDDYRSFLDLAASQIANAIANARAHEEERKRAEALAEIDRAKTAFFSNVSHEFRTPLTLMLGPLEDALAEDGLSPEAHEQLEVAHRNSLRLLKLVNTLLDFSRIEAGRIQAVYEPVDLAALTADLASVFRSAIERAGMRLIVDCPPLDQPVYIDREMWEKITLNLISNAFKFTFEGEIEVSLKSAGASVQLAVRDTGMGISADELPHIFDRFHRVKGVSGRSYEGSGIGLALVQELVKLHGGTARVQSEVGRGSSFIVSIPFGKAHLPAENVKANDGEERARAATAPSARAFVEEALRWAPIETKGQADRETQSIDAMDAALSIFPPILPSIPQARILLADDNSDMREYVKRLLATNYEVEAVADGEAALQAARERPPDLVLSDVMMPKLDGFGLLKALREDERMAPMPVILLSARAGEEARVEGLEAGADDYLIKPFSARELLARVRAHLEMTRLRREAEMALRHSEKRFRELADNAPLIIWMTDGQGNNEFVNKAYQSFFGVAPEEVAERRWMELVHPDDYETYVQKFLEVSAARLPFRAEARVRRADGEWRWLDSYAIPRSTESGHTSGMIGCSADITERKQAEDAMGQLVAIVESSDDAIVSKDLNGVIRSWNIGAEKLFGYAAEEVIGKSIMILIPPDRADEETRVLESVRRGEKVDHYETVRRRKDGALVEISLTISPLRNKAGNVIGASKIARDITERRRAEQALAEGARQQRALYQLADHLHHAQSLDDVYAAALDAILSSLRCDRAAISLFDDAGVMRFAGWRGLSDGYRKAVEGYSSCKPDERCLEPICVNDVDMDEIDDSLKAVVKGEGIGAFAFIPLISRGKLIGKFMTYFNAPHVFRDDELALSLTIARQLAFGIERKRAEKLFRQNAAQLALITDTAPVFIAHCDAQARFKFVNKAYAGRFGLTPVDCIGKPIPEVVGEEAYRSFSQYIEAVLRGEPVEFEVEIPYEAIGKRFMHCSYAPEFDANGNVDGFVAAITDISARKHAEEKIARLLAEEQAAREVAEQATRAKDEFLALVSHELRSPLNAILGYTRMLRSDAVDREGFNKATGVIERSAKAQLQIIEDLLDSARIVTGKLRIEPSLVDLVPALDAALDTVRSAAEAKGVMLVANFRRLPELVLGDSTRLQQIVWNLLTNAVKFTPEGGQVELRMDEDADHIRIAVSDTGKGIEPEFLPFVFDRFRQADSSSGRRYGGVGLGLSLVKHLVELHGGTITAASEGSGRGAIFTVMLPRRHLELIPPAPPAVAPREVRTEGVILKDQSLSLEGVSVLVVDDQEEARVILTEELSEYGAQVTSVSSGAEALTILSRPPDGRSPDALILDIAMPDEDGYAVLKKVRALEAEQGNVAHQIPAIALTAHAMAEDRFRALQAGFQMHVAKPVEPTELALVILSLIKRFDIKPGS
jgi:PAS domain S-box-containing protein